MPLPEDTSRSSVTAPLPVKPGGGPLRLRGQCVQPKRPMTTGVRSMPRNRFRVPELEPRRRGKLWRRLLIGLVLLIVIVYGAGVVIFSNIYYPGTTIAGADVSLVNAGSAEARIRSAVNRYTLTIEGSGFSWQYAPENGRRAHLSLRCCRGRSRAERALQVAHHAL